MNEVKDSDTPPGWFCAKSLDLLEMTGDSVLTDANEFARLSKERS